jgi:CBS domain-containing protein
MNRLILQAETAEDLMTSNPVSVSENTTSREAASLLTYREINAVPVINQAGRPIGVLSRADLLRHDHDGAEIATAAKLMTPTVIAVAPKDSALEVVAKMAAFKIHHMFVVDAAGVLVGVISSFDVVRKLRREQEAP